MDDYQRTMCDNVLNAAIVAGTAPLCLTWTATKYAKNSWKWLTSQSGNDEYLNQTRIQCLKYFKHALII